MIAAEDTTVRGAWVCKPSGRVLVPRARGVAVALGLAMGPGARDWLRCGPLDLPELPRGVTCLTAIVYHCNDLERSGKWEHGDNQGFWRPRVWVTEDHSVQWSPWTDQTSRHRFLRFSSAAERFDLVEIEWLTGTGRPSRFIGSALIAAAGGLDELPNGIVSWDRTA